MENELDIGDIVLCIERSPNSSLNDYKVFGWIVDKYVDDENEIRYSIEWADGFSERNYNEREVDGYLENLNNEQRSLHK